MPFTGKTTYSGGVTLPEIAEDISDIIGIVSPFETPLLDFLGDSNRSALSTIHEWLEDSLLPNSDVIDDASLSSPTTTTAFDVANGGRFQVGDQIKHDDEVMLVTDVTNNTLTVVRQYGGTPSSTLVDEDPIQILGNAALEGADAPTSRFTNRMRMQNYSQIFTASIEVSGSQLATQSLGIDDEMDFQKQERVRELLRDLENCVINGVAATSNPQGSSTVRRTMRGVLASVASNVFEPGVGALPFGGGSGQDLLSEEMLNAALREIWLQSSGSIDTIVCGGFQKRQINSMIATTQRFADSDDRFSSLVNVYESDYGVCRVVLSRWVPADKVMLLDSSRIDVLPLSGRSFYYKPLASTGDSEAGQIIGEYTMECRNENAHGVIENLGLSA